MDRIHGDLPPAAQKMLAVGPRTEEAVRKLFRKKQLFLFEEDVIALPGGTHESDLGMFANVLLASDWKDEQAAEIINRFAEIRAGGREIDTRLLCRWVLAHPNDTESVVQCMTVEPPQEIEILKVLSKAGSQKTVFLALWRLTHREVVLKRILRPDQTAVRELQSFPINLSHPNIIETHRLQNSAGELFLVEKCLARVLNDAWRADGIQEGANLLFDMAAAIKFLHEHDRVHGDIKPDNIGSDSNEFILLDFGICRPTAEFSGDMTATGSLRTRAPELLLTNSYVDPPKVDVWALGATLFAAYVGRFPLLDSGEAIPRISHPEERQTFESKLRQRAAEQWEERVATESLPEPLRAIVGEMLQKDPKKRISSTALVDRIERELSAFLRRAPENAYRSIRFSPLDELTQLEGFFRRTPPGIVPAHKRLEMVSRLKELQTTPGFDESQRRKVSDLVSLLG